MKACFKQLKAFLALEVKKRDSLVAFLHVKFSKFLDLDKFLTILSVLSRPTPLTISSLAPSALRAGPDYPVIFNIEMSSTAILLKSWIKRW